MHFVELIFFALEQHAVDPLQQVGTALCSKEIVFANVYLLRGGGNWPAGIQTPVLK